MDCSQFRKYLDNYENLDDLQLRLLYEHTEVCQECRCELEFFNSVIKTTASIPVPEMPADFIEKVNKRIDAKPQKAGLTYNLSLISKRYATVAACIAVGLVVGINRVDIEDKLNGTDDGGIIQTTVTTVVPTEQPIQQIEEEQLPLPVEENKLVEATPTPVAVADSTAKPIEKTTVSPTVKPVAKPTVSPNIKSVEKPTAKPTIKLVEKTMVRPTAKPVEVTNKHVQAQAVNPTIKPVEMPVVNQVLKSNEKPEVDSVLKPTAKPVEESNDEPLTSAGPTAEVVEPTQVVATATPIAEPSLSKNEDSKKSNIEKNYTFEREGYYVPDESNSTNQVTDQPNVDNYSLATSEEKTEYSYKEQPTVAPVSTVVLADYIVVSAEDIDTVVIVLNELEVASAHGLYMTQTGTFYEILARLNDRGISYDYSVKYTTGDRMSFKVLLK